MTTIVSAQLSLIVIIIIAIAFIVPKIGSKLAWISWKGSLMISGLYLGILLMLVPLLFLLPKANLTQNDENRDRAVKLSQNTISDLYRHDLPAEKDLDKIPGLYRNSSHNFKVDSEKLFFNVPANIGLYPILVARKNVDDGQIDVSTYVATQFIKDIDYTKFVLPPIIAYHDGTLSFKATHQSLKFIQGTADFTVNQFRNQNAGGTNGLSTSFGDRIVYIRVPQSLEIDNETKTNSNVQMISSD
ncbi:hypothetical protein [Desulfosporosinus sp. OT]|uniref:hypothetical protein n=1 Tax=Desulfosporosinus sp. OT TaxID=913865 RepID=UPI000223AAEA|nr:hypothetical protein [Desulfosporosinus sp. OT]EGW37633.1 hypothetical protein DOT_4479 [Desulfosporosinus sp. OT]